MGRTSLEQYLIAHLKAVRSTLSDNTKPLTRLMEIGKIVNAALDHIEGKE